MGLCRYNLALIQIIYYQRIQKISYLLHSANLKQKSTHKAAYRGFFRINHYNHRKTHAIHTRRNQTTRNHNL